MRCRHLAGLMLSRFRNTSSVAKLGTGSSQLTAEKGMQMPQSTYIRADSFNGCLLCRPPNSQSSLGARYNNFSIISTPALEHSTRKDAWMRHTAMLRGFQCLIWDHGGNSKVLASPDPVLPDQVAVLVSLLGCLGSTRSVSGGT